MPEDGHDDGQTLAWQKSNNSRGRGGWFFARLETAEFANPAVLHPCVESQRGKSA